MRSFALALLLIGKIYYTEAIVLDQTSSDAPQEGDGTGLMNFWDTYLLSMNQCEDTEHFGFYYNVRQDRCMECPNPPLRHCLDCHRRSKCDVCEPTFILRIQNRNGVSERKCRCPDGHGINADKTACEPKTCPAGEYFENDDNNGYGNPRCQACLTGCNSCHSGETCDVCTDNAIFHHSNAAAGCVCAYGYAMDAATGTCVLDANDVIPAGNVLGDHRAPDSGLTTGDTFVGLVSNHKSMYRDLDGKVVDGEFNETTLANLQKQKKEKDTLAETLGDLIEEIPEGEGDGTEAECEDDHVAVSMNAQVHIHLPHHDCCPTHEPCVCDAQTTTA